ncbi:MAG: hypothetical protein ACI9MR_005220, partial [Myxococcota bacterium]
MRTSFQETTVTAARHGVLLGLILVALSAGLLACGGSSGGAQCDNGVLDAPETDIDCGAFCGPCEGGQGCLANTDCTTGECINGICSANAATCADGRTNGAETDVDCGGTTCEGCVANQACGLPTDCVSAICEASRCAIPPTCSDALLTPGESDLDCGGPCTPCATGKGCGRNSECLSATCVFGVCKDPTCDDSIRNQAESDIDCGGPCGPCALGQNCGRPEDCATQACEGGACCEGNACGFCGESPADICDGQDNDCDGTTDGVDELGAPPSCEKQDGVCAGLGARCEGAGGWVCDDADYTAHNGGYEAQETLCDGVDNDCDGSTDEGEHMPNQPPCAKQQGLCQGSVASCRGDQGNVCSESDYESYNDGYESGAETLCDNLDNNCDGSTDEGLRNACGGCGAEAAEVCDNRDNDCDGQTDEGLLNACGTCGPAPAEACDGLDNDCDGATDEGADCAGCSAAPVPLIYPAVPQRSGSNEAVAFKMADGKMCGAFFGGSDTTAIFFCLEGGQFNVFHTLSSEQLLDRMYPLGNDLVYVLYDSGQVLVKRLTRQGGTQDITSTFPGINDVFSSFSFASSGSDLFYVGPVNNDRVTLVTLPASGAATSQTVMTPNNPPRATVYAPEGNNVEPVVTWGDYRVIGGSSVEVDWYFWRNGTVFTERPHDDDVWNNMNFDELGAISPNGNMYFYEDVTGDYSGYVGGSWGPQRGLNGQFSGPGRPTFGVDGAGAIWAAAVDNYASGTNVLSLVEMRHNSDPLVRSTRVITGFSR